MMFSTYESATKRQSAEWQSPDIDEGNSKNSPLISEKKGKTHWFSQFQNSKVLSTKIVAIGTSIELLDVLKPIC